MDTVLELKNIVKTYGNVVVLRNLSLSLEKGDIGCLLGPSGCGKTTVLRTIAGFELFDEGEVLINRKIVASGTYHLSAEKRKIGMVFQDYALFPHLSVHGNIGFGLHGMSSQEKHKRISQLEALVGLEGAADYFPHELSGGQQQRVALARALAPRPQLLLLDEPFSNLDITLRERLSMEVRRILKTSGTSALMVTHNQQEAFAMADVIGVMHEGKLEQWDTAYNLYHRPASPVVAEFIGEGVLLPCRVAGPSEVETGLGILRGRFIHPCKNGCTAHVLIRPEDIVPEPLSDLKARVLKKNFRGANIMYTLKLPSNDRVLALLTSHHNYQIGQEIPIAPKVEDIILFEAEIKSFF
ncbi:MAG: ABC transporter ATP-binding protein [Deltaproteobacteria bacterium]|nr:ABC transporter ATP-binding protein [Deltaproteobacteria bacterium]MBW2154138.1 ABC transporter ATP-binding protein [Deltaproteobacteria bacterium]